MQKKILILLLSAALGISVIQVSAEEPCFEWQVNENIQESPEEDVDIQEYLSDSAEDLWMEEILEQPNEEDVSEADIVFSESWKEDENSYEIDGAEAIDENLFSSDMDIFAGSSDKTGLAYPVMYTVTREKYDLMTVEVSAKGYKGGSFHWLLQDASKTPYSMGNPPTKDDFQPADQEDLISEQMSHSFVLDTSNVEIWIYLEDEKGNCTEITKLNPQSWYYLAEAEKAERSGLRSAVLKLNTNDEAKGASVYYKIMKPSEEDPVHPWSGDGFIRGGVVTDSSVQISLDNILGNTKNYPASEISELRCLVYLAREDASGKITYSDLVTCVMDTWPVIEPESIRVTSQEEKYQVTGSAINAYQKEKKEGYEVVVQHYYQYTVNGNLKNYIKTEVIGHVNENGKFAGSGNVPAVSLNLRDTTAGVSYKAEYKSTDLGVRFMKTGESKYYYSPGYVLTIPRVTPAPAEKPNDPGIDSSIVTGLENEYILGQKVTFRVIGAGMNNKAPKTGDIRYYPYRWRAALKECTIEEVLGWKNANGEEQGNFKLSSNGDYYAQTSTTANIAAGSYPITIVYRVEKWNGIKWDSTGYEKQVKYFKVIDNNSLSSKYIKLSGIKNEKNGVTITWNSINGVPKYRIFRKTGSGSWKKVADTTKLTYKDTSVYSNTVYTYTVRGLSEDGKSYITSYDPVGLSINYLATPVLKSISNSGKDITISWNAVKGVSKYRIYRRTGSEIWRRVGDTSALGFTDRKINSGVTYTYTVRGISADGKKFISNFDNVGLTTTFLSMPALSFIANYATGIHIKWSAVEGADGYIVYRKCDNETHWSTLAMVKSKTADIIAGNEKEYERPIGTVESYTDSAAVKNGGHYTYTVRAYKGKIKSNCNTSGITIYRVQGPTITGITSTGSEKVKINWNKNGTVTGHQVQYSTNSNYTNAKMTVIRNNAATATLSGLISGKSYYVRMRNYKMIGGKYYYSGWSNSKIVKVK